MWVVTTLMGSEGLPGQLVYRFNNVILSSYKDLS